MGPPRDDVEATALYRAECILECDPGSTLSDSQLFSTKLACRWGAGVLRT